MDKPNRRKPLHVVPSKGGWTVMKFDPNTLVGEVSGSTGAVFVFHSTSFRSETSFRFPCPGEAVEVATTPSGALLSVHGK